MKELKPCPFCGGEARAASREEGDCKPSIYHIVGCSTDYCIGEVGEFYFNSEEEAVKAWNTRSVNEK